MTFPFSAPPYEQQQQYSSLIPHPLSGDAISPAYIHTVQHLIEKCLLFELDREECVASLERHANVKPAITRTGTAFLARCSWGLGTPGGSKPCPQLHLAGYVVPPPQKVMLSS